MTSTRTAALLVPECKKRAGARKRQGATKRTLPTAASLSRTASCKFTRHSRLKKRREFRIVLDNGRSRAGRTAVIYAHFSAASQHRLGLIVSRRVGSAVVRNRLKRVARELFRQHRNKFEASAPLDFVVIAKRRAADTPHQMPTDLLRTLQILVNQLARS